MKKFLGFTLAEVLITITVVGVISAITLPILIKNYQQHVIIEQLKYAYSLFGQVLERSKIDNGETANWDRANAKTLTEKYFNPYIKGAQQIKRYNVLSLHKKGNFIYWSENNNYPIYSMPKGISYAIRKGPANSAIYILVDINGPKSPNIAGKDVFVFVINDNNSTLHFSGGDRNYVLTNQYSACSKKNLGNADSAGLFCGRLIQLDGWKFSSDYPW